MAWVRLPDGADVSLKPGFFYAFVASLKKSHTQTDVAKIALKKGLTLIDYVEEGQRAGLGPDPRAPDYREIAATALATVATTLPWEVPWPASLFDDSKLVEAWESPPETNQTSAPAVKTPAPTGPAPAMDNLFIAILVAGALLTVLPRLSKHSC